ncbi:MAG: 2-hydroxyacid dehydrogenase, partial [Patescibacteria group bacterium]
MKFKKITCLNWGGNELEDSYGSELDSLAEQRVLATESDSKKHPETDVLLVKLGAKIGKELIDSFPNLKYIGMLGTGYGGIDTKYAAQKGITVTNIADYATEGVAEFTLAILLEHLRSVEKAKSQAKQGNYSDDFIGKEIKGKTFGVIGLGHIGLRTAELAKAFGANVIYWSHHRKKEAESKGIKYSENVLSSADIITVNLALNSETENYLNADRVASIKRGAIVINPSPMELFDFNTLVDRLKKGDITFILDHSDEMTTEQLDVLKSIDNCIIYP